jgi:hypothetical protein
MANTRFFEVLSILKHNDHKIFDDLLNSPYFNKNLRVKNLWNYVKVHTDGYEFLQKEDISTAIFKNEKFTESNYRMVISAFVKLVEEYMLQKEYNENEMEKKIRLLEVFEKRGMKKSFSMYLKKVENELDRNQKKDSVYYYRKYFIECLKAKTSGGDIKTARGFAKKAFQNLTKIKP